MCTVDVYTYVQIHCVTGELHNRSVPPCNKNSKLWSEFSLFPKYMIEFWTSEYGQFPLPTAPRLQGAQVMNTKQYCLHCKPYLSSDNNILTLARCWNI